MALGASIDGKPEGLSVLAMGKLGGREIGYGSDLDVVFLYDPARAPGGDPIAHYSRVARRVIQLIGMPHREGRGYELDTRLRPSGSQGLLVTSLEAFARYHEAAAAGGARGERAATWERLALLRARFAAGDGALGAEALAVATRAAYDRGGTLAEIAADVHPLRQRIERELARERPGRHDLKHGRGGLVEVELVVQVLQLVFGRDPRVRTTETRQAIEALAGIGALGASDAEALREGYRFLRRLEQRLRVLHGDGAHLLEQGAAGMPALARRLGITGPQPAERLLDQYRRISTLVRACYERIVASSAGS
jgi:glutamate-ammonia-ligase adenylyltransferase